MDVAIGEDPRSVFADMDKSLKNAGFQAKEIASPNESKSVLRMGYSKGTAWLVLVVEPYPDGSQVHFDLNPRGAPLPR